MLIFDIPILTQICIGIIAGITQHPTNDTYCEGSNAVLSCVIFDNNTNNAADNTKWFDDDDPPVAVSSSMISNSRDGDVVTSVLTIESVSLNDNGIGYFSSPTYRIGSNVGKISVEGEYAYTCIRIYEQYNAINKEWKLVHKQSAKNLLSLFICLLHRFTVVLPVCHNSDLICNLQICYSTCIPLNHSVT